MSGQLRLKGGPELQAFLEQLPVNMERNILRGALRAGANVIRDEARANVPSKTGKLRRAIKTDTVTEGPLVKARIKIKGKHSYLARFVEYGILAHFIQAGDSGLSSRKLTERLAAAGGTNESGGAMVIGGQFVRGAVLHPGVVARPFLRPAFDIRADDAARAVADHIRARLTFGDRAGPTFEVEE